MSKKLALKDLQDAYAADRSCGQTSNVEELYQEISVRLVVFQFSYSSFGKLCYIFLLEV